MQKFSNVSLSRKENIAIISIRNNLSYQTADELRATYDQIKDNKTLVVSITCMNILEAMDIVSHVAELMIFDSANEGMEYLRNY